MLDKREKSLDALYIFQKYLFLGKVFIPTKPIVKIISLHFLVYVPYFTNTNNIVNHNAILLFGMFYISSELKFGTGVFLAFFPNRWSSLR
jgi:hypothetical protein